MGFITRLTSAAFAGALAFWFARGIGIPVWRDGWSPGDASDCAVAAACLVVLLTASRERPKG